MGKGKHKKHGRGELKTDRDFDKALKKIAKHSNYHDAYDDPAYRAMIDASNRGRTIDGERPTDADVSRAIGNAMNFGMPRKHHIFCACDGCATRPPEYWAAERAAIEKRR